MVGHESHGTNEGHMKQQHCSITKCLQLDPGTVT